MIFPVNSIGVVWLVPIAEWAWEDDPAGAPTCDLPAGIALPAGGPVQAVAHPEEPTETGTTPCGRRLVLKGFRYTSSIQWVPFDSPLAQPWQRSRDEEAKRADDKVFDPLIDGHAHD